MSTELTLFLLRLISGALLVARAGAAVRRHVARLSQRRRAGRSQPPRLWSAGRTARDRRRLTSPTGQTYPLLPLTSLGRSPTNTIPISDDYASGEHALVALRSGQWWLEDRQSRNGTTINGMPITQPVIITDGDIIGVGSVSFPAGTGALAMDLGLRGAKVLVTAASQGLGAATARHFSLEGALVVINSRS